VDGRLTKNWENYLPCLFDGKQSHSSSAIWFRACFPIADDAGIGAASLGLA